MTEWFQERYVSRQEHQEAVDYYRKLVASLQVTVCELRSKLDTPDVPPDMAPSRSQLRGPKRQRDPLASGATIIHYDFRGARSEKS